VTVTVAQLEIDSARCVLLSVGIQVAIIRNRLSDYVSCFGMRLYSMRRPPSESPALLPVAGAGLPVGWAGYRTS
jgi:hypothetical protein